MTSDRATIDSQLLELRYNRSKQSTNITMAFLLTRPSAVLGLGLGTSLCLSPLSPFRASPMQCQYASPYYRPEHQHQAAQTGWGIPLDDPTLVKQGNTKTSGSSSSGGLLTARNMRQVSMGSVLGLVAGVGLRAFSRVLAVVIGMGIVFVEVLSFLGSWVGLGCWMHANDLVVGCFEGI